LTCTLACAIGVAPCFGQGKATKSAVDRKQKEHVQSLMQLASLHENNGDVKTAIDTLLQANKLVPDDRTVSTKLLSLYDKAGEPSKKIPIYQQRLKKRPKDEDSYLGLGTAYYEMGQKEKARANWEKALACASRREAFYRSLAQAYQKFSLHHEAVVALQKGCGVLPKSYRLHYDLAMALEKAKRYPEAIAAFEKALTLTKSSSYRSRIDWRLLALYKLTGTFDEAVARRRKEAQKLRQELGAMYWALADEFAKAGREKDAAQYRALAESTGVPRPKAKPKAAKPETAKPQK